MINIEFTENSQTEIAKGELSQLSIELSPWVNIGNTAYIMHCFIDVNATSNIENNETFLFALELPEVKKAAKDLSNENFTEFFEHIVVNLLMQRGEIPEREKE